MTVLLKVVSFNLDYEIAGVKVLSAELWVTVFLITVLVFRGDVLNRKRMIPVLIYTAVVLLMDVTGHLQNAASPWFKAEVLPVFLAATLYELYFRDYSKDSRHVLLILSTYVGVSLFLNIIGLYNHPIAVREITSGAGGWKQRPCTQKWA